MHLGRARPSAPHPDRDSLHGAGGTPHPITHRIICGRRGKRARAWGANPIGCVGPEDSGRLRGSQHLAGLKSSSVFRAGQRGSRRADSYGVNRQAAKNASLPEPDTDLDAKAQLVVRGRHRGPPSSAWAGLLGVGLRASPMRGVPFQQQVPFAVQYNPLDHLATLACLAVSLTSHAGTQSDLRPRRGCR